MLKLAEQCQEAAALLKALAHPERLKLLCHLSEGEKTVGQLEGLCVASQSQISQFLGRMKSENLLEARREGQHIYYSIKDQKVSKLIKSMQKIFCT